MSFEQLSVAQIHVYSARQARVKTPHRPHNVDALELVWAIFLENWGVLHGILVRPWCSRDVARIRVPGRRRVWMVVRDFAVANDYVMRQNTANRFVEAAADGILRHGELRPGFGPSSVQLRQCL